MIAGGTAGRDNPGHGNDMDTYADDLAAVFEALDLNGATLVGYSTGGGEIADYVGRNGTKRVAKMVLIGAVPPLMLKTEVNPTGLPMSVFDGIRAGTASNRSKFFKELALPFYGYNRPHAKVEQGVIDEFWREGGWDRCSVNTNASSSSQRSTTRWISKKLTFRR
jgi:non-heme chloroperoxidase